MAKKTAVDAWLMIAGFDLTGYVLDARYSRETTMEDSHTFGDSWRELTDVAIGAGVVERNMFYDDTTNTGTVAELGALTGAERVLCLGFEGQVRGARFIGARGVENKLTIQASRGALHKIAGPIALTAFVDQDGVILHPLGTFASTSGNDTSVDNGAQSTGGGAAYLQVVSNTGNFVAKVQDSANNSTFADIATFATVPTISTTPAAERVAIAGTIRQYTRSSWTNSVGPASGFVGLKRY